MGVAAAAGNHVYIHICIVPHLGWAVVRHDDRVKDYGRKAGMPPGHVVRLVAAWRRSAERSAPGTPEAGLCLLFSFFWLLFGG